MKCPYSSGAIVPIGSSSSTSMRESARRVRPPPPPRPDRAPGRASRPARVVATNSRRVGPGGIALPFRVATNHSQREHRRDLAPFLCLEAHRHLAPATDDLLGNGILDVEEAVRACKAQLLAGDPPAVHPNLEVRRQASAVTAVVRGDQGHGMGWVHRHIVGKPAATPPPPPRPAHDTLRDPPPARPVVEPPLADDLAGLEIRHRG